MTMEDLSNADGPQTSCSMSGVGQEANTETAHIRTHSPEQECEPLSEQHLQERVKQLQNGIETLKKLLQLQRNKEVKQARELENNREFQNKIQERLQASEKEVLELRQALDAQKNVCQITTSKAQKAIDWSMKQYNDTKKEYDDLKNEYDDLKKENDDLEERFDVLNGLYMQQQVEDEMKKMNVGDNEVDGSTNVVEEKTALTISDEILPFVRKALKPSFYWSNPFKCPAACVMSATHFVLSEGWKNRLCEHKFARVVQKEIDEMNNKIQQGTNVPTENEKIQCSYSLKHLYLIGLLQLEPLKAYSKLCDASKHLKTREKALIVIFTNGGLSHCMAIYKCSDQSKPNAHVEIFDVQSGKMWPREPEHVANVTKFEIYRIEESKKKQFKKECSISLCFNERKCACLYKSGQQSNAHL